MKKKKHLLKIANVSKKSKDKDQSIYNYKIGHNNIRLTVERVEVLKKSDFLDLIFYYHCVFCNKDFDSNIGICPDCNHALIKVNLKKCQSCGAKNNPAQQSCWVCKNHFPKLDEKIDKKVQLLLTLDLNNHFYKNTDETLSLSMKKLFEDLISTGFSKEPLKAWLKIHEGGIEYKKEFFREKYKHSAWESKQTNLQYIIALILPIIICLIILIAFFWVK